MKYHDDIIENISFTKVTDTSYVVNLDETIFQNFMNELITSFTSSDINLLSPIMDISLGEEITNRIIADSFLYYHKEVVKKAKLPIMISFTLNELVYHISIANNQEKLGGIVYGLIS